jgi:hypothetical protein
MSDAPDEYDEISTGDGQEAASTENKIMEFKADDGDTFAVFEHPHRTYIGRHISTKEETEVFYEVSPESVAEQTAWPFEAEEGEAEVAIQPLLMNGWEITHYDEENATRRMGDIFGED